MDERRKDVSVPHIPEAFVDVGRLTVNLCFRRVKHR
jgi:hypothetical protein